MDILSTDNLYILATIFTLLIILIGYLHSTYRVNERLKNIEKILVSKKLSSIITPPEENHD